ncbi:NAD(P)H-hydrate dehydratase [Dehalococcoidia bacterium]|nr:NAD(P)H-hydrate dehydratase [Dehalococcoidia bacterium]
MKIVTVSQMQALEIAAGKFGVSADAMMEKAGLAVARHTTERLANYRGARIIVLVGPGNNGGDGLVAAIHLHQWGANVQVYICVPRRDPDPKLSLLKERGIPITSACDDPGLSLLQHHLASTSIIIDAVLGTGSTRPLNGQLKEIMGHVSTVRQRTNTTVLALDLPTGLNADTGYVDPACPGADITIAMGYPKLGHFTFPGASIRGELEITDIGLPPALDEDILLDLITPQLVRALLPSRPMQGHKNTFGRLMVVAGSRRYVGAAWLACSGAYRVGAGLVTLAAAQGVYAIGGANVAEVTHLPLPETAEGGIASRASTDVRQAIRGYSALVMGCGLGQAYESQTFVRDFLFQAKPSIDVPMVLDADALNTLAKTPGWYNHLNTNVVLTPHPGEMAMLTGHTTDQIQRERLAITQEAASRWGQVVVLKGAFTIIASPDGTAIISPFANPALASAGTGDVLAGIIGGLLAQGLSPMDAGTTGVYLHAAAALNLSHTLGDSGLMASDLLPELPRTMKALKSLV